MLYGPGPRGESLTWRYSRPVGVTVRRLGGGRCFWLGFSRLWSVLHGMTTTCKGPHYDFDDFTTYDLTTFTTLRIVIDLETCLCTVNIVSRSITSRESREVVSCEVIQVAMWSLSLCHI